MRRLIRRILIILLFTPIGFLFVAPIFWIMGDDNAFKNIKEILLEDWRL